MTDKSSQQDILTKTLINEWVECFPGEQQKELAKLSIEEMVKKWVQDQSQDDQDFMSDFSSEEIKEEMASWIGDDVNLEELKKKIDPKGFPKWKDTKMLEEGVLTKTRINKWVECFPAGQREKLDKLPAGKIVKKWVQSLPPDERRDMKDLSSEEIREEMASWIDDYDNLSDLRKKIVYEKSPEWKAKKERQPFLRSQVVRTRPNPKEGGYIISMLDNQEQEFDEGSFFKNRRALSENSAAAFGVIKAVENAIEHGIRGGEITVKVFVPLTGEQSEKYLDVVAELASAENISVAVSMPQKPSMFASLFDWLFGR